MKPLDQLTSREIEIELLKRAIRRGDLLLLASMEQSAALLKKQRRRMAELARQETQLKLTTDH